ncbi:hypothetical protein Pcinc_031231 [Petrolisthes cinctipes]|uniref:Uncharacterized protein n=1 Tax=Petrolisthes cinctipes TaxID=88211 RepID=A0AAE1K4U1_PETCI|nr:hypothetical protein Pcinc_031231 [Petrolisthes cinctipes]
MLDEQQEEEGGEVGRKREEEEWRGIEERKVLKRAEPIAADNHKDDGKSCDEASHTRTPLSSSSPNDGVSQLSSRSSDGIFISTQQNSTKSPLQNQF